MSKYGGVFLNRLSHQVNPNIIKPNTLNILRPTHSLLVRKLNLKDKSNKLITKEINDYLNLPEKFFASNSKITVGKKIKLTNMNIIGMDKIAPKKMPIQSKRTTLRRSYSLNTINLADHLLRSSVSTTFVSYKDKLQQQINNDKYDIVDYEQLKKIFNKFKTCIKQSNENTKRNIFLKEKSNTIDIKADQSKISRNKEMPLELAQTLSFQNNKLIIRQNIDNKIKNISKNISKLLNKKEKDLLLNKVDDYPFKKELLKEVDFNKPIDEKYGIYKWNISLRRPVNFKGVRNSYINLKGERFVPFWSIVVEKCPKQKELIIRPGHIFYENERKEFKKKSNLSFGYKNQYFQTVENLEDLSVNGKNLYNLEYKREIIDSKNNKILHKVFFENGKAISTSEINNLYGNDTFYKDYTCSKTEKNPTIDRNNFSYKL